MKLSSVNPKKKKNKIFLTLPEEYRKWQAQVLEKLKQHRLAVVVAHRRAGKTELVCVKIIKEACLLQRKHPKPFYAYIAPFLNQAKVVAWDRLKYYSQKLPKTVINESELTIKLFNGSTIKLFGADYPDRLRGLGFDGVVMDEVAQMRPELWPEIVRPCLADRKGWAVFIGTPKGRQNKFYELYQTALKSYPLWYSGLFSADKTDVIDKKELNLLAKEMGESLFQQEFLCDFTVSNEDGFIDYELLRMATNREVSNHELAVSPMVFGLDPARFGNDRTVLVRRRGRFLEEVKAWQGLDLMQTAGRVAQDSDLFNPRLIFVDAVGLGAGVVDRLKQLGYPVLGVVSGASAQNNQRYYNLRAEMWAKMRAWLLDGGSIPDQAELRADLLSLRYHYDHLDRLKLEKKEDLKSRGLPSPDCADALALTFAYPLNKQKIFLNRAKIAEF